MGHTRICTSSSSTGSSVSIASSMRKRSPGSLSERPTSNASAIRCDS
jgi:hypothetical protein